ncbi:DMT family transporter [Nocardioides nanhaiensis]|uniref:DMT family transporter n=1 Tax=Nocardioides nanhaiensis TaxID=1476871 RepID=A0ABP8VQH2_9ACTN
MRAPGLAWGLLGVAAFSLTVPLTRVAVEVFSPWLVGAGRAVLAACLAGLLLRTTRARLPDLRQALRLVVVGGGVVLGFPLLTSLALTAVPAAHGAVVVGVLPAATAVAVVLRTGERPSRRFWVAATCGLGAAMVFAARGGVGPPALADLLLLGAVLAAAIGYAEGGLLARELGAWQTVSWALVCCLPATLALASWSVVAQGVPGLGDQPDAGPQHWASLGYLALVSAYLGFFAWYRGLALGPMTTVSQVQLAQPVLSLVWAALLLGEPLSPTTIGGAGLVVLSAGWAVRSR